jgi:hypothetical protein
MAAFNLSSNPMSLGLGDCLNSLVMGGGELFVYNS